MRGLGAGTGRGASPPAARPTPRSTPTPSMNRAHLGRRAARRRRRAGRHRCGDGRRTGERLLRRAPARPPCLPRPRDGLLLLQQHGRRGARTRWSAMASSAWPSSTSTCTTATAPRTSWPATTRVLMVELLPAPVLSVQRRRRRMRDNMVNLPVPAYTRGMAIRELIEQALDAAAGGVQARDDLHQRRLRRPPRRRPGPAGPGRAGLRLDHVAHQGHRAASMPRAASCPRWKAATTSSALGRSVEAHVRVLADL